MNYPQSSCPCEFCPESKCSRIQTPNDQPCSLGFANCKKPFELGYCTSRKTYDRTVNPLPNAQVFSTPLNTIGPVLDKKWYVPVQSNLTRQCKVSFAGFNPLLVNQVTGQRMLLDRPEYTGQVRVGNVPHDEIYTKKFSDYGKNYTNYNTINGGDIQYYIPNDQSEPYFKPVFTTPALVEHTLVANPMGVVYPEYNRISANSYDWNSCAQDECDSFTHDSLEFRQELMEKQMRKMNEQNYSFRYSSLLK